MKNLHKVGDKVTIMFNEANHDFEIGTEVIITEVIDDYYRADSKEDFWHISDEDLYAPHILKELL